MARTTDKMLVEMLESYRGRVYHPCRGSSGMFVQSVEFTRARAKGNGALFAVDAEIDIVTYPALID